jgi:hypothetical protein
VENRRATDQRIQAINSRHMSRSTSSTTRERHAAGDSRHPLLGRQVTEHRNRAGGRLFAWPSS